MSERASEREREKEKKKEKERERETERDPMLAHVLPRVARGGGKGAPPGNTGNTCASMGNFNKLGPKTLQIMRFSVNF